MLQRIALRASTAAPTVFKPVSMGGEIYCDGGIVASNPSAVAIHEARTLFPDVPIEMVVSCGTGGTFFVDVCVRQDETLRLIHKKLLSSPSFVQVLLRKRAILGLDGMESLVKL